MKDKKHALMLLALFSPLVALGDEVDSFLDNLAEEVLDPIVYLLFALAIIYFVFGAVKFMLNADNPTERDSGKSAMIWGIIGLFIMVGVYGIVWFLRASLGI